MKTCTKCKETKPATAEYFHRHKGRSDGLREVCKLCRIPESAENRAKNKDNIAAYKKDWRAKNKSRLAEKDRQLYAKNRAERLEKRRQYRQNNRKMLVQKSVEYKRERSQRDPVYRAVLNLRRRVSAAIRGRDKSAPTMALLGCSIDFLKQHLAERFKPGMNWENYGSEWHVDHIRPCASFDLTDPAQQRECFHYTNLQPLWAVENMSKQDKWAGEV